MIILSRKVGLLAVVLSLLLLAVHNELHLSYGYPATSISADVTPTPLPTPVSQLPTARVEDPHQSGVTYFPEVGHTLRGRFLQYWQEHGGLAQFGYPLTEEYTDKSKTDGKEYVTQYFERARFEYHPENQPPYDVLLGLLGLETTESRRTEVPFRYTPPKASPGGIYFSETGHILAEEFISYWQDHGGLPVYGYPISNAFQEQSATDGKMYLVQYFERNRLEFHPELSGEYSVSLGLLGADSLRARGWLP